MLFNFLLELQQNIQNKYYITKLEFSWLFCGKKEPFQSISFTDILIHKCFDYKFTICLDYVFILPCHRYFFQIWNLTKNNTTFFTFFFLSPVWRKNLFLRVFPFVETEYVAWKIEEIKMFFLSFSSASARKWFCLLKEMLC